MTSSCYFLDLSADNTTGDEFIWFQSPLSPPSSVSELVAGIITMINVHTVLTSIEIRDVVLTDRTTITVPVRPAEVFDAYRVSHIVIINGDASTTAMVYRVHGIETSTTHASSIRYIMTLDPLATATVNCFFPMTVSALWDVYPSPMGESVIPYEMPMTVIDGAVLPLPKRTLTFTSTLSGVPVEWDVTILNVFISGVTDGVFKTFWCPVMANLQADNVIGGIDLGQGTGSSFKRYPTLREIINHPDRFTPFTAEGSIISASVSYRAPFSVSYTVTGDNTAQVRIQVAPSPTGTSFVTPSGQSALPDIMMMGYDDTLRLSHRERIADSLPFDPSVIPMVSVEVRDGVSNLVGNIDRRFIDTSDSEGTRLASMEIETVLTYTGVNSRLILPDGSMITWPEGVLPYNTSAYIDYLATMARYDREMVDIAQQRALTDLMLHSSNSILNGVIAGGLTSGGVGAVVSAVDIIGGGISFLQERELAVRELEAKEERMKLLPDNAYTSGGEVYLSNVFASLKHDVLTDAIVFRAPLGSVTVSCAVEMSENVRPWFDRAGYPAGGRPRTMTETEILEGYNGSTIKARQICAYSRSWADRGRKAKQIPGWLMQRVTAALRQGVRLDVIRR